jgi:5-methylcytosine-specific restriction endonuclease McrA
MPMIRSRYPKDWDKIARTIKAANNWKCANCDRPCRQPDEPADDFSDRIRLDHPKWAGDLEEENQDDELGLVWVPKVGRFTLTVAHLDHHPSNCEPANLKALCSVCHCRYDLKAMPTKRRLLKEFHGQQTLDIL